MIPTDHDTDLRNAMVAFNEALARFMGVYGRYILLPRVTNVINLRVAWGVLRSRGDELYGLLERKP